MCLRSLQQPCRSPFCQRLLYHYGCVMGKLSRGRLSPLLSNLEKHSRCVSYLAVKILGPVLKKGSGSFIQNLPREKRGQLALFVAQVCGWGGCARVHITFTHTGNSLQQPTSSFHGILQSSLGADKAAVDLLVQERGALASPG